jgi:hypothetical protein
MLYAKGGTAGGFMRESLEISEHDSDQFPFSRIFRGGRTGKKLKKIPRLGPNPSLRL